MKALTLQRPWPAAFLLSTDPKRIENRTWVPPKSVVGKRIALHAGKGLWTATDIGVVLDGLTVWEALEWGKFAATQGVFATAVVDGHVVNDGLFLGAREKAVIGSRWWLGPVAWVLKDFRALAQPIQCKGRQGIWTLPGDVESRVRAALEGE